MLHASRVRTIAAHARRAPAQARKPEDLLGLDVEKATFELARLKAWKFGAKTEAMSTEQRRLFEEVRAEDEASLQAQLDALRGTLGTPPADTSNARRPRRQPLIHTGRP